MKPVPSHDGFHLEAARGWCELHAYLEANDELEKISSAFSVHPDVLEIRWQIYANLDGWEGAVEIAGALIKLAPGNARGWLYKASSLHGLKRSEEALANSFHHLNHSTIARNLPCILASFLLVTSLASPTSIFGQGYANLHNRVAGWIEAPVASTVFSVSRAAIYERI